MVRASAQPDSSVLLLAPFPPPYHGMTIVSSRLRDRLQRLDHVALRIVDTSPGALRRSPRYHARKIARIGRALVSLLRHCSQRRRAAYVAVDAGPGMLYTAALAAAARLLGYRLFLHHHTSGYLGGRTWRGGLLTTVAGAPACHIALCEPLRRRLSEVYPTAGHVLCLSNAFCVDPVEYERPVRPGMRLGHLGNLACDKGLALVVEVLRRVAARDSATRLVLAGPVNDRESERLIRRTREEFGEALDYRGPVHGADKQRFFRDVDVFLFPSQRSEGQPMVLLEALSHGVPVIARGSGCIAHDLADGAGLVVASDEDFVERAATKLDCWLTDPALVVAAADRARRRFLALRARAATEFGQFVEQLV